MNSIRIFAFVLLLAVTCQAGSPIAASSEASPPIRVKEPVNYTIHVEWKDAKKGASSIQVVTGEGNFALDTISGSVKVNDSDVPTTVKLTGTLAELNSEKARLQIFLGRTVPYVTGTLTGPAGGRSSSYSQLSVGLQSTFIVTFGKPLIIQTDDNGTVSILVKRDEN
jgi:hypothetical protein